MRVLEVVYILAVQREASWVCTDLSRGAVHTVTHPHCSRSSHCAQCSSHSDAPGAKHKHRSIGKVQGAAGRESSHQINPETNTQKYRFNVKNGIVALDIFCSCVKHWLNVSNCHRQGHTRNNLLWNVAKSSGLSIEKLESRNGYIHLREVHIKECRALLFDCSYIWLARHHLLIWGSTTWMNGEKCSSKDFSWKQL